MNKIFTFLAAVLITASTFSQTPEKMSYQAVIRDAGDVLISNQPVGMQISILQTTATGTSVYTETQTPTTNVNGLVSIEIGTGTTTDDFSSIDWSAGPYFVKTETDPNGGTNYSITGTSQLLSVPYALHAKTAESVTGVNLQSVLAAGNDAGANDIINVNRMGIGTAAPNAESSIEITTALPVIFPSMTQAEVNNIVTPVEGMVQFNTDAHKLQVYAELIDNADILNEIYIGNESGPFGFIVDQNFTSPIDGVVIAVELLFKDDAGAFPEIDFSGQGTYTVPSYSQFTWHTFILTNPIPVTAGGAANFEFIGPGVDFRSFATNSNYPNGSMVCCLATADDDVLFRIHIQPNPGSFGWQNMN